MIAGRSPTSSPDVVLDVPGEYQQPGINTNAPLEGTSLGSASVLTLDGDAESTADWFGSDPRPMVINFWFTTCPPCRREMPVLQHAFLDHGDEVRFIGVNVQDSASTIRSFVADLGVTYDMVRDDNGGLVVANGISAFPTTLFVTASGRIVGQVSGELTATTIEREITELLTRP